MKYDEAKKTALQLNGKLNACREFKKAYHFYEKTDEEIDGDFGVVILKSNGKAIDWITFIMNYHPEKNPVEIEF